MTDTTGGVTLYERTLYLVQKRPHGIRYEDMGDACGRTRAWVSKFAKGQMPDASIASVQRLHDFLENVGK